MQTRPATMSARILLFLIEVLRPILLLIGFVLRLSYQVFFSWWLNPVFDHWIRSDFAKEIRQAIPSLFDLHGGRVVPDPKPSTNDRNMSYLCVASTYLVFKLCRWHGENYAVQVAPRFSPTDFYDLLNALRFTDPTANTNAPLLNVSWRGWGELLEPRFLLLERAFSAEEFPDTKARLAGMPKAAFRSNLSGTIQALCGLGSLEREQVLRWWVSYNRKPDVGIRKATSVGNLPSAPAP